MGRVFVLLSESSPISAGDDALPPEVSMPVATRPNGRPTIPPIFLPVFRGAPRHDLARGHDMKRTGDIPSTIPALLEQFSILKYPFFALIRTATWTAFLSVMLTPEPVELRFWLRWASGSDDAMAMACAPLDSLSIKGRRGGGGNGKKKENRVGKHEQHCRSC